MSNIFYQHEEPYETFLESLQRWSMYFEDCLIHISWDVYLILGFFLPLSTIYYLRHRSRKLDLKKRRQKLQRARARHMISIEQGMWSGDAHSNCYCYKRADTN